MSKIKPFKQAFYETCLTVCLLLLVGIKPSKRTQLNLWRRGWKKDHYLTGQLNYLASLKQRLVLTIGISSYFKEIKNKMNRKIVLEHRKINIRTIKEKLKDGPVIILLDDFYLYHYVHYAHALLALKAKTNKIQCIDPWDGRIKWLSTKTITQGILSLRRRLWYSPILISKYE